MGTEHYISGLLRGTPSSSCGELHESNNPSRRHIIAAGLDAGVDLGASQESEHTRSI